MTPAGAPGKAAAAGHPAAVKSSQCMPGMPEACCSAAARHVQQETRQDTAEPPQHSRAAWVQPGEGKGAVEPKTCPLEGANNVGKQVAPGSQGDLKRRRENNVSTRQRMGLAVVYVISPSSDSLLYNHDKLL